MQRPPSEFEEPGEVRPMLKEQLYCFIDGSRPCSAACVSFMVGGPGGNDHINQKWVNCMLLVNAHRATKVLDRMFQLFSNASADARRAGNAPHNATDPITGRQLW